MEGVSGRTSNAVSVACKACVCKTAQMALSRMSDATRRSTCT